MSKARGLIVAGGSPLYRATVSRHSSIDRLTQRARREALLTRLRYAADVAGATVEVDIPRSVRIGKRIRIEVAKGTTNVLTVGAGTKIGDDVALLLRGGTTRIGNYCDVRRGVTLNVSGELTLEGINVVSWSTVIHCAAKITIGSDVGIGEFVTIVDSSHFHDESGGTVYGNVETGHVTVGANTLLAAKVTLTRNARVGENCIIGANSVVTGTIPDWTLASGVPAKPVKALRARPCNGDLAS